MPELLEEEFETIEIFRYVMNSFGHEGYYSFCNELENGYFIYKENKNWVLSFNKKGENVLKKKYSNIYNLCLDILEEQQIDDFYFKIRDIKIPSGTRVVVSSSNECPFDEIKWGVIINSELVLKDHSHSERIYHVMCSNGRIYDGPYGYKLDSDICFRTMEDYIKDITRQREVNIEISRIALEENQNLYFKLVEAQEEKDDYLGEEKQKIK